MSKPTYDEVLNALYEMARQHCCERDVERDHNGQLAGTRSTNSAGISANRDALVLLAREQRFRIVAQHGRMVVGYWPENDPMRKSTQ